MRRRFRRSSDDEVTPPGQADGGVDVGAADEPSGSSFDALLARQLDRVDGVIDTVDTVHTVDTLDLSDRSAGRAVDAEAATGFWDHYDRAAAEAELTVVPPASVVAVVGPLAAALPVIRRCRDQHWMGQCDIYVLTQNPLDGLTGAGESGWTVVDRPSDLVAVLEDGRSDFPLLVLDVPSDLPAFVRPLVARLRNGGVGLVHYVLDGEPVDEDLATWHGELGQPAVLELAAPVGSDRVLELFDRGEPVVSVAGRQLTTEMLLALRIEATQPAMY